MKNLYIRLNAKIKMMLGICNSKGCYKRAIADIEIKEIGIKRCLCDEHLEKFRKCNVGTIKSKNK